MLDSVNKLNYSPLFDYLSWAKISTNLEQPV